MPALPLSEIVAGYEGALSMASNIAQVLRGGAGTRSVISISEALKKAQGRFVLEAKKSKRLPTYGTTLLTGQYACYNIYKSLDGRRFAMAAMEEKFWMNVCEILDLKEFKNQRFTEGSQTQKVKDQIQFAFDKKTAKEWAPIFAQSDCCVELVAEYNEVFNLEGV